MDRPRRDRTFQVRVEQEVRDAFLALCEIDHRTPSEVLRRWIYDVVSQPQNAAQIAPRPVAGPSEGFGGVFVPEADEEPPVKVGRADRRRAAKRAKKYGAR